MFRLIHAAGAQPYSFIVDPSAEFEPGQVAQLSVFGNQTVCGVSDGSMPIGIIDDMKKNAFSAVSVDEVITIPVESVMGGGGQLVSVRDVKAELDYPHISINSFMSNPLDVALNAKNGVITFLAGTPLNYSLSGSGVPDSFRTVVNYRYQIPNIPGDDSTASSGRVTVWFNKMFLQTDQYETNQRYPLNAPLFVNESGLFTTRRVQPDYPSVAIVTATPSSTLTTLELLWM